MYQTRFKFPNRHGGNRKHNWAQKQKRRGKLCPVPHRRRCEVEERFPMHVTMRLQEGLENLRTKRSFAVVREALRKGKQYGEFRLHQFSVQSNHMHMIVEASDRVSLARGIRLSPSASPRTSIAPGAAADRSSPSATTSSCCARRARSATLCATSWPTR